MWAGGVTVAMARFVFITGGVVSSLGKGLTAASLGALLQARGYTVRLRKLDPYINVDPGTMSPYEHGEVFVTDDGAEADLDLGHYERFTGVAALRTDSISSGRIYSSVIEKERRGDYLGKTIQVIPHVTDAIKEWISIGADDVDFMLCEIGGTVGDIEGLPFFEAARQFAQERPRGHCIFMHLTLVPLIGSSRELKTKPTQHSVKELRAIGIAPDVLVCRAPIDIPEAERAKIALFCNVRRESIITARDLDSIYEAPIAMHRAGLDKAVLDAIGIIPAPRPQLGRWHQVVDAIRKAEGTVRIAVVGKYTRHKDAYKSVVEALDHGGISNYVKVHVHWIDAELLERTDPAVHLGAVNGVVVPGGFGERGTEGMINAITYARVHQVPFFGLCFGMHMAVIEATRQVEGMENAGSEEFDDEVGRTRFQHVIFHMKEWVDGERTVRRDIRDDKGGTMRLGAYVSNLIEGSKVAAIYQSGTISERHRHRFEVDIRFKEAIAASGLTISGISPDGTLPEIIERDDHPWFIGVQFHPELKSKPFDTHPLFASFIKAAMTHAGLPAPKP